ncbi:hypothetical protein G6O45_31095, partial [Salmonella enterica subsp. enterica serovar Istanbul]|nr:hypothetical protein [Salmonella enterica subsp. enterica serovar Istanbul]
MHEGFVEFYGPTPARTVDEYLARIDRQWLRDAEERAPDERAAFLVKLDADERALR